MGFQRKKIRKQIEDVLNMYIETEKYPPEMIFTKIFLQKLKKL